MRTHAPMPTKRKLTQTRMRPFKALASRGAGGQPYSGSKIPTPALKEMLSRHPGARHMPAAPSNCTFLKTVLIRKSANVSA